MLLRSSMMLCIVLTAVTMHSRASGSVINGRGETPTYPPAAGKDFERCLNILFPPRAPGTRERALLVLRFLPSSHPEAEIVLDYGLDSRATVEFRSLRRPLQETLRSSHKGLSALDLGQLERLTGLTRAELPISPAQAKEWLKGFFDSAGQDAAALKERAFRGEASGEMYVQMDGTRYIIELQTGRDRFSLETMGSEIDTQPTSAEDLPVIEWMNSIRRRVLDLLAASSR